MMAASSAFPRKVRRASKYATGVPPTMPSRVAAVAAKAVSKSDCRNSASLPRAPMPRTPPDATRPATGPMMNSRNNEATMATTTDATARDATGRPGGTAIAPSSAAARTPIMA